jgi:hypothetical protein
MESPSTPPSDRSAPIVDPLSVFIDRHRRGLANAPGQKRFNAGEHAWLGGAGVAKARERLAAEGILLDAKLFDEIPRRDGREVLQYGELVALSGDFYETPEALFDEKPSPLPWLWESNDLSDLRTLFQHELDWIERRLDDTCDCRPYPDENIRLAWNAKSYVELALRNTDHFGWHNQLAYVRHHRAALDMAARSTDPEDPLLRQALYTNAFADHFLTDGFAAGHIRVPRAEICDWAAARGDSESVAGALSKLLHDQDGHVDLGSLHGGNSEVARHDRQGLGLPVRNAHDERWETYCDGQLFLNKSEDDAAVKWAVEAVADSVTELMLAWKRRKLPEGIYLATRHVPFPDPEAPTLIGKFPADLPEADLERLWQGIAWWAKGRWFSGLRKVHLRALFEALPELMAEFRRHVEADRDHPDVALIHPAYVDAFARIA